MYVPNEICIVIIITSSMKTEIDSNNSSLNNTALRFKEHYISAFVNFTRSDN